MGLISSLRRRAAVPGAEVSFLQGMVYEPPDDNHFPARGSGGSTTCASTTNTASVPLVDVAQQAAHYDQTCSICLDDFERGDTIRVLTCNHAFHASCVDEWLVN